MPFVKTFPYFKEGLAELCELSFSASQAVRFGMPDSELPGNIGELDLLLAEEAEDALVVSSVLRSLAWNVANDRNHPQQPKGRCSLVETSCGASYKTCSGLTFGWTRYKAAWNFQVAHPLGVAPVGSSLRQSAEELGWQEVS